jgi:hypothetical protein
VEWVPPIFAPVIAAPTNAPVLNAPANAPVLLAPDVEEESVVAPVLRPAPSTTSSTHTDNTAAKKEEPLATYAPVLRPAPSTTAATDADEAAIFAGNTLPDEEVDDSVATALNDIRQAEADHGAAADSAHEHHAFCADRQDRDHGFTAFQARAIEELHGRLVSEYASYVVTEDGEEAFVSLPTTDDFSCNYEPITSADIDDAFDCSAPCDPERLRAFHAVLEKHTPTTRWRAPTTSPPEEH